MNAYTINTRRYCNNSACVVVATDLSLLTDCRLDWNINFCSSQNCVLLQNTSLREVVPKRLWGGGVWGGESVWWAGVYVPSSHTSIDKRWLPPTTHQPVQSHNSHTITTHTTHTPLMKSLVDLYQSQNTLVVSTNKCRPPATLTPYPLDYLPLVSCSNQSQ